MKPPLARLKRLAALLVAGAISSSYACYWQIQTTCATDGTTVDNVTFPAYDNSGNHPAWGSAAIKANGTWQALSWWMMRTAGTHLR